MLCVFSTLNWAIYLTLLFWCIDILIPCIIFLWHLVPLLAFSDLSGVFTFFDSIVLAWWDAFDMNSGKECKVMYIYCAVLVKFTEVTVITSCRSESSKKLLGHIRQDEQSHQSEAVHRHNNKWTSWSWDELSTAKLELRSWTVDSGPFFSWQSSKDWQF